MSEQAKTKNGKLDLRAIAKANRAEIKKYETAKKKHHASPSEYQTKMRDSNNLIEFDNLQTYFFTDIGTVKAVNGVSFDIPRGSTIAVVGESGCGKSVTSLSLMRLVQGPQGQIVGGSIRYQQSSGGQAIDLTKLPDEEIRKIRGKEIAMIFQEPMTSLNPVFRIGKQLGEAIHIHLPELSKEEVHKRTVALLEMVGIARAEGITKSYPHELSGGMRQRVMIAMALALDPQLIVADEPTTALDVTIQAQILDLLRELKDKINASIMLITHDLGVVAEMADYVVVMYAGRVIEQGTAEDIYDRPAHPYTIGLLGSIPVIGRKVEELYSIPGNVPNPIHMPDTCYFKERCERCVAACDGNYPDVVELSDTHKVWCYRDFSKR
ncbi:dipeptide/oligopeptide/nickel ABC transporter ATP-binding protein [Clostridia bacterium]|nr:dipeptide/oligopeptide/nickel ABC transporter ATP-binding protein [Clostridia bacterium]